MSVPKTEVLPITPCPSGDDGGTRTPGPVVNSHLLYQLSYAVILLRFHS